MSLVAGVFSLTVCVLLVANVVRLRVTDPAAFPVAAATADPGRSATSDKLWIPDTLRA